VEATTEGFKKTTTTTTTHSQAASSRLLLLLLLYKAFIYIYTDMMMISSSLSHLFKKN